MSYGEEMAIGEKYISAVKPILVIAVIEKTLSNPDSYGPGDLTKALVAEYDGIKAAIDMLYETREGLNLELEAVYAHRLENS